MTWNDYSTDAILCNIIQHEMGLTNNQIWIYDQNFEIPNTPGLFVVTYFESSKTLSNNNHWRPTDSGIIEYQSTIQVENLTINIFSKDRSSKQRKHEIILALNSIYSEQMQEKYAMRLFPINQSFNNASRAEGESMLNRYTVSVKLQRIYNKVVTGDDYFDKFEINVDNGILPKIDIVYES